MKVQFKKMSGAGNDFVLIDWRHETDEIPWGTLAPGICDRKNGVGADGLIVIRPGLEADFTMEYFNADGSTGSMCGNGGRCAARHMIGELGRGEVTFSACGEQYRATSNGDRISLGMIDPSTPRMNLPFRTEEKIITGHFIDTGAPHLVIPVDGDYPVPMNGAKSDREILRVGRILRNHAEFSPVGTNVDFVDMRDEDRIRVRTYEKGVENETLACGTGAVAVAVVTAVLGKKQGRRNVTILPRSGDELRVSFLLNGGDATEICLDGPAVVTFTGVCDLP